MAVLVIMQNCKMLSQYLWIWLVLLSVSGLRVASYFVNSMIGYKEG
jgi:hypothetical protein